LKFLRDATHPAPSLALPSRAYVIWMCQDYSALSSQPAVECSGTKSSPAGPALPSRARRRAFFLGSEDRDRQRDL